MDLAVVAENPLFLDALNGASRSLDDKALLELGKKVGLDPERLAVAITKPPAAYDKLLDDNQRRFRQRTRRNPALPTALFNARWPTKLLPNASPPVSRLRVSRPSSM